MRIHRSTAQEKLKARVALAVAIAAVACSDPVAPEASLPPAGASAALSGSGLFYNVQLGGQEGTAIYAYFQYSGTQFPIMQVNEKWATAKKLSNGYWVAKITNVLAGMKYTVELYTLEGKWTGTVKTYSRQIAIDLDSVRVTYDGDWGANCGDFHFRFRYHEGTLWQSYIWSYPHDIGGTYCIDSGDSQAFSDQVGRYVLYDFDYTAMGLKWEAFDYDGCGQFSDECGDGGFSGAYEFSTSVPGKHTFKIPSKPGSDVDVMFIGTVTVSYVPW